MSYLTEVKLDSSYVKFMFESEANDDFCISPYYIITIPLTSTKEIILYIHCYSDWEDFVNEVNNDCKYRIILDLNKINNIDYISSILVLYQLNGNKFIEEELIAVCSLYKEIQKLDKSVLQLIGKWYGGNSK